MPQAKSMTPQRPIANQWIIAALAVASISGCGGPSQEDLMMRAARRPRPAEESEPQPPVAATAPVVPVPPAAGTSGNPADSDNPQASAASATPAASGATETASESSDAAAAVRIASRRPPVPLSDLERRERSAANLRKIGEALAAYVAEKGRLPLPASKTASGIATLSWRVELLPYLGHEDLYQKFDLSQTWDSPHNRPLLDLIPDCYVSPERFDSSTNYLGVSGRTYLFNGNYVPLRKIEDGLDNTLAIVEVDEAHAVPWTRPADYAPELGQLRAGIGQLRPEGIYAVWANGLPTQIKAEVGEQQLHRAFTYESGDGLVAGEIHTELVIQELQKPEVAATPTSKTPEPRTAAADVMQPAEQGGSQAVAGIAPRSAGEMEPRMAVPSLADLAAATQQVEQLYAERVKAAKAVSQRTEIARTMLSAAMEMRDDPAGAYALQTAAIQLSATVGDLETASEAIDNRVAMFEVDPLQQNGEMLTAIGRASVGPGVVDGRAYLQRALPVLRQAIEENKYDLATELCQFAIQFESQTRDRILLPSLNRLRLQITAARNQHHRVEAALALLRKDPSNPAANSTVGMYLAFIKGDWRQGLSLLASGENEQLARISAIDAATTASATSMMSTADAWWELGESTTQKKFRAASRERAAFWYAQAMESLPESLARMHAQARIREAEASGVSTPLKAIAQIAVALGVDPRAAPGSLESAAMR